MYYIYITTIRTFGVDRCYTNMCLDNVDNKTVKRLEEEGASAKTIDPIQKHVRKYHRCVANYDFVLFE